MRGFVAALLSLSVLSLCSCQKDSAKAGAEGENESGKPVVVGTVTMIVDLLEQLGGDEVEVVGLMGPGVDPHSYQPRGFSDAEKMEKAAGVFYLGLHLEGKMQEGLESLAKRRDHVYVVSDFVGKGSLLAPEEEFEDHYDPHVWGDPKVWLETVDGTVAALSKIVPEKAETFTTNGESYKAELVKLNEWAQARVAEVPAEQRVLVTSHDAFFYFGKAFGFEVRGLQGLSTVSEIGLKDRKELVDFIKAKGLKMIFPESSVNPKAVAAIAKEAGVKLSQEHLFSDALGESGDMGEVNGESYDKGTYIGMMKHNVNAVVEGLK